MERVTLTHWKRSANSDYSGWYSQYAVARTDQGPGASDVDASNSSERVSCGSGDLNARVGADHALCLHRLGLERIRRLVRSLLVGEIGWVRAISVQGWTQQHKRDYDYAMIVLSRDIGSQVGWLGYGWNSNLPRYNVNINGYPGDKPFGTMWHSFCGLQIIQTFRLYYACDTFGGMSGSGVYVYLSSAGTRTIYGIHAYGVDSTGYNGATRITESVFNNLKNWKATY